MKFIYSLLSAILFASNIHLMGQPLIQQEDKVRIAEAINIAEEYRQKLWPNWYETPFAILLVYEDYEFLINHPYPSDDFKIIGFDSLLNTDVYYRERVFDTKLLSAFPAVSGLSTIVVGTPENTGKSSVDWIITILHEHFHQYQSGQPDYYSSINNLDLAGGDESGMWMLNYPFPYDDERVNEAYDSTKKSLVQIFKNDDQGKHKDFVASFIKRRNELKNILNEKDYRYFSFQLWQEGIARYTEIKLMQLMIIDEYKFSDEVKSLEDFKPLNEHLDDYYSNAINLVNGLSLRDSKRICFYAFGAFEGLLLDEINPGWKENYFINKFYLEKYYND